MAYVPCYFLLLPLLITSFFGCPIAGGRETQELIAKICRRVDDFGFCSSTFNKNLRNPRTNAVGLTQITLEQANVNAVDAHILIHKFFEAEADESLKDYYRICLKGYGIAMDSFQEAFRYFGEEDYRTMLEYESRTERPVNECVSLFNQQSQLFVKNQNMKMLISMALVTGGLLVD